MEPTAAFAQLQLGFVDQIQWRYEVIRPLVLFADRTPTQWAQKTATHPDTVRTLRRRFQQQGMLGLMPATLKVTLRGRATRVPDAVRREVDRLKALYAGFHARELARILFFTFGYPIRHNTVKRLWQQSAVPASPPPTRRAYRAHADRADARLQIGRMMDFALEGVRWWSLIILDGYSRTMLAGEEANNPCALKAPEILPASVIRDTRGTALVSQWGLALKDGAQDVITGEGFLRRRSVADKEIELRRGGGYRRPRAVCT